MNGILNGPGGNFRICLHTDNSLISSKSETTATTLKVVKNITVATETTEFATEILWGLTGLKWKNSGKLTKPLKTGGCGLLVALLLIGNILNGTRRLFVLLLRQQ